MACPAASIIRQAGEDGVLREMKRKDPVVREVHFTADRIGGHFDYPVDCSICIHRQGKPGRGKSRS